MRKLIADMNSHKIKEEENKLHKLREMEAMKAAEMEHEVDRIENNYNQCGRKKTHMTLHHYS